MLKTKEKTITNEVPFWPYFLDAQEPVETKVGQHTPPKHAKKIGNILLGVLAGMTLYAPFAYHREQANSRIDNSVRGINIPSLKAAFTPHENTDSRLQQEKFHLLQLRWSQLTPKERSLAIELQSVTPEVIKAWEPQHEREDNGWHEENVKYSGGLNFLNESWVGFGGTDFAPTAAQATIAEQIAVARRVQASVGDYTAPDPNDGTPGW